MHIQPRATGPIDDVNREFAAAVRVALARSGISKADLAAHFGWQASEISRLLRDDALALPRTRSRRLKIAGYLHLGDETTLEDKAYERATTGRAIVASRQNGPCDRRATDRSRDAEFASVLSTFQQITPLTHESDKDYVYVLGSHSPKIERLVAPLADRGWRIKRLIPDGAAAMETLKRDLYRFSHDTSYEAWRAPAAFSLPSLLVPRLQAAYVVFPADAAAEEAIRINDSRLCQLVEGYLETWCTTKDALLKIYLPGKRFKARAKDAVDDLARTFHAMKNFNDELNIAEESAHQGGGIIRMAVAGPPDVWVDDTTYGERAASWITNDDEAGRAQLEQILGPLKRVHGEVRRRFGETTSDGGRKKGATRMHIYTESALASFAQQGAPSRDDSFGLAFTPAERKTMLEFAKENLADREKRYEARLVPTRRDLPKPRDQKESALWELVTDGADEPIRLFLAIGDQRSIVFDRALMLPWKKAFDDAWTRLSVREEAVLDAAAIGKFERMLDDRCEADRRQSAHPYVQM